MSEAVVKGIQAGLQKLYGYGGVERDLRGARLADELTTAWNIDKTGTEEEVRRVVVKELQFLIDGLSSDKSRVILEVAFNMCNDIPVEERKNFKTRFNWCYFNDSTIVPGDSPAWNSADDFVKGILADFAKQIAPQYLAVRERPGRREKEVATASLVPVGQELEQPVVQEESSRIVKESRTTLEDFDSVVASSLEPARVAPSIQPWPARPNRSPAIQQVLDHLSHKVRRKIEADRTLGKVDHPKPLPLRWSLLSGHYADHVENATGHGEGASLPAAGGLADIADFFRAIPSHRLVVLGDPGGGKTVLLGELALGLLQAQLAADTGVRLVPVPFSIAAWNPIKQPLRDWLVQQLCNEFPKLARTSRERSRLATELVHDGWVLPLIDGLDEMPLGLRAEALRAINGQVATTDPLVITSRHGEYADTFERSTVLSSTAVIWIEGVTLKDLAGYLPWTTKRTANGEDEKKWSVVLDQLQNAADNQAARNLLNVLSTPHNVFLARSMYSETDAKPKDLLDLKQFPHRLALLNHLLAGYIPAVYAQLYGTDWQHQQDMFNFRWTVIKMARQSYGRQDSKAARLVRLLRGLSRRRKKHLKDAVSYGVLKRSGTSLQIRHHYLRECLASGSTHPPGWVVMVSRVRGLELYADVANSHARIGDPRIAEQLYGAILRATRFRFFYSGGRFIRAYVQLQYAAHLYDKGEHDAAIALLRTSLHEQKTWFSGPPNQIAETTGTLAAVLANSGKLDAAAHEIRVYARSRVRGLDDDEDLQDLLWRIEAVIAERTAHSADGMQDGEG